MTVLRQKYISRTDCQTHRDRLYVFGDNMVRSGYGGQAGAMRGEPNSFGIPTKWFPNNQKSSFFYDEQFDEGSTVWLTLHGAFAHLTCVLDQGYDIVIPLDGLGTGLSRLPEYAPTIANYIEHQIQQLETQFGRTIIDEN